MGRLLAFFLRDLRAERASRAAFLLQAANVVFSLGAYLFLSRHVRPRTLEEWSGGTDAYFPFVLVGMAAHGAMLATMGGLSRGLQVQRPSGLLAEIFLGPCPGSLAVAGSGLHPMIRAAVDFLLYLAAGTVLAGLSWPRADLPAAALALAFSLLAFLSLAIWGAAAAVLLRAGQPALWAAGSLSWLLGGVLYPGSALPGFLTDVARLLPLTHAAEALRRSLLQGASIGEIGGSLAALTLFAGAMLPAGLVLFNLGLRRARLEGTLGRP